MQGCTFEQIQDLLEPFGEFTRSPMNFIPNNIDLEIATNLHVHPNHTVLTIENTRHNLDIRVVSYEPTFSTTFTYS